MNVMSLEELVDNEFLRQFEIHAQGCMAKVEYVQQERKIFLTKLEIPDTLNTLEFKNQFLELIFETLKERNTSVVPTSPAIAKFIRKNRKYKSMLPVGIRI